MKTKWLCKEDVLSVAEDLRMTPITDDRIDEILTHHQRRDTEILSALRNEPKTAYEISQEITWMPSLGGTKFQDLRSWDKRMAVMETLAHLKAMKDTGKVAAFSSDSTIYYNETNGR